MVEEYQRSMLSLFIELELKLAELYGVFAGTFLQENIFFKDRQAEELQHAQWIEYFKDKAEQGAVLFHEDKTRTYTLKSFLAHVETILRDAKAKKLTLLSALSLSASIEDSLIERKVFDHFKADSQELQNLIGRIRQETGMHAAEMKKLRSKYSTPAGGVR